MVQDGGRLRYDPSGWELQGRRREVRGMATLGSICYGRKEFSGVIHFCVGHASIFERQTDIFSAPWDPGPLDDDCGLGEGAIILFR